jgi:hypothetical protein
MGRASKTIKVKEEDIPDQLYAMLDGRVFHITPYKRYAQIKKTGFIIANHDGKLGFNFSEKSFGRHNGWVCLFDFRTEVEKIAGDPFCRWGFFFRNQERFGNKLSFLFLDTACHERLIRWDAATKEQEYTQRIPHAECWYPGSVPLDAIVDLIHIQIIRRPLTGPAKVVMETWKLRKK